MPSDQEAIDARRAELESGVGDAPLDPTFDPSWPGAAAPDGSLHPVTLVLDEKTAFPRSMRIGGEIPFMVMSFDELEFLDPESLDSGIFEYTPPEDAKVIDMGATITLDE